jgi:nuclear transport factor 2 (NTF2) superfamily protein
MSAWLSSKPKTLSCAPSSPITEIPDDYPTPPAAAFHGGNRNREGKWQRELDYRLIKELWGFRENRMAVRFAYEWHDDSGNWFRSYGNENWEFDENGLMRRRFACINDTPIRAADRRFHWPLGRRPDDHPGLSDLGF